MLAACSYAGGEYINAELLFRHPSAPVGLGKRVLQAALQAAYERDCCEGVVLAVREENKRAIRLYQALGFTASAQGTTRSMYLRTRQHIQQALRYLENQPA